MRGSYRQRRGQETKSPPAPDRRRTASHSSPRNPAPGAGSPRFPKPKAFHAVVRKDFLFWLSAALVRPRLELDEILDPHLLDQPELSLEPVDMLLLAFQDIHEQFAADVILDVLAMRDCHFEVGQSAGFQR